MRKLSRDDVPPGPAQAVGPAKDPRKRRQKGKPPKADSESEPVLLSTEPPPATPERRAFYRIARGHPKVKAGGRGKPPRV